MSTSATESVKVTKMMPPDAPKRAASGTDSDERKKARAETMPSDAPERAVSGTDSGEPKPMTKELSEALKMIKDVAQREETEFAHKWSTLKFEAFCSNLYHLAADFKGPDWYSVIDCLLHAYSNISSTVFMINFGFLVNGIVRKIEAIEDFLDYVNEEHDYRSRLESINRVRNAEFRELMKEFKRLFSHGWVPTFLQRADEDAKDFIERRASWSTRMECMPDLWVMSAMKSGSFECTIKRAEKGMSFAVFVNMEPGFSKLESGDAMMISRCDFGVTTRGYLWVKSSGGENASPEIFISNKHLRSAAVKCSTLMPTIKESTKPFYELVNEEL